MTTLNVAKVFEDLPRIWAGFLQDWDRTMRSRNHPDTTRYNYVLAAAQLARYLKEHSPDFDSDAAADDPTLVTKGQVEAFQAWVVETRSASTALNKHKALQQFFKWLVIDEEEMDRSPMDRVGKPKTPEKLIPVLSDADTKKVLDLCKGKSFANLRDHAIIRLLCNTGARLSEVGDLTFDDIDLATESVRFRGKGAKDRRVRFGPKTARALSRYLRARATHRGNELPFLWLADRGGRRLAPNGIKIMLRRLGEKAGIERLHAHRWRHSYAHEWKRAGADTGDLMLVLGWTSDAMPRHYGRSAAAERALETQQRLGIGERV
ncbi:tyrosine-type recombinase/integrase [Catellatospora aurea]|uniref:Tyrosine-type recombinase/integrase n=1 Tax=Catellatospora aurea TaxID=1337874 RepID=A0ABW2H7D2_9ACTN